MGKTTPPVAADRHHAAGSLCSAGNSALRVPETGCTSIASATRTPRCGCDFMPWELYGCSSVSLFRKSRVRSRSRIPREALDNSDGLFLGLFVCISCHRDGIIVACTNQGSCYRMVCLPGISGGCRHLRGISGVSRWPLACAGC